MLSAGGRLDARALEHALGALVERHEILRTSFEEEDSELVQVIASRLALPLPAIDLEGLPAGRRDAEALRRLREEAARPFDLGRAPLLRPLLFRLGEERHLLLLGFHHIVTDAWSNGIVLRELPALYEALRAGQDAGLPALPLQYADFATWQRQWLQGAALERRLAPLVRRLEGVPSLTMQTDRPRPEGDDPAGAEYPFPLPAALSAGLRDLARDGKATLFMVLLAGFEALLLRYTGQGDFAVGSPVANRNRLETENVLGFFTNTLALRAQMADDPSFREHLARVRTVTVEAFAHEDVPFEKLVEVLRPERRRDRNPLFQVLFSYQQPALPAAGPPGGLVLEPIDVRTGTTKFDLSLHAGELPGALHGLWEYSTALFDPPTIGRLAEHLKALLADAVAHPDRRLSDLAFLAEGERQQLRAEWNPAAAAHFPTACLHERFAEQAARTPDAVAVSGPDSELTYRELKERAGALASHLRSLGVAPDQLVGLCVDRSPELLVGILGILEAGGAYLPLDPAYPAERLAFIVRDAGASVLVARRHLAGSLPETNGQVVILEDALEHPAPDLPPVRIDPANLAYVIYTSGSTGTPKGVQITHANASRLLTATEPWFGFGPDDVWSLFHSFAFDFSVWEIWGALLYGGRLVVVPYDVSRSPEAFLDLLRRERVTVLNQTPSAFGALVREVGPSPPSIPGVDFLAGEGGGALPSFAGEGALRLVIFGGEALSLRSLEPWFARFGDREPLLVNMYGITETTVHVTYEPLEAGSSTPFGSPIGRPIPDLAVHLVDRHLRPLPIGVPGEILVGGAGLARGYLGRPALTAERFVPDFLGEGPGAHLYRSGDLARRLTDGRLEFLGRIDRQVKVRGFRIEPGEIEAALSSHPEIREAAVTAVPSPSGETALAAFVVPRSGSAVPPRLRELLAERLPDYMVPALFAPIEALPRTASGKVDRSALPEPWEAQPAGFTPPRTPVEEVLAGLWSGLLHVERLGPQDDFFALGGHSLTATSLASQVRAAFGVELPARAVFESPVLSEMADRIEALLQAGQGLDLPPIVRVPRTEDLPLSFSQQRLWFLDELAGGASPFYNVPAPLALDGPLDAAALESALGEIVRRHEALRTTFRAGAGGRPIQEIYPPAPFRLPWVDLRGLPDPAAEADRLVREDGERPFSLKRGPLFRATLLRSGEELHTLLLSMHHIVSDGWSIGVLLNEIAALYSRASSLPDLPVQYADFAVWQRRWLAGEAREAHLSYWRRQLAGAPATLEIPAENPQSGAHYGGATVAFHLPETLTAALESLARQRRSTLFMGLFAAFAVLLSRFTGQEDLVLGTPVANRGRSEVEGLIGFFVNLLALRADLTGEPAFVQLLDRVRETALGAYTHQDLPFETLVEALRPPRHPGETPFVQAVFSFQEEAPPIAIPGLDMRPVGFEGGVALFDLTLAVTRSPTGLLAALNFKRGRLDTVTAQRLLEQLQILLEGAAANPNLPVADLPLWSEAAWHQATREWNDRETPSPAVTVDRLVAGHAERSPDAVAVSARGQQLTYGELVLQAGRLAEQLRQQGVGPEVPVALCLERSPELAIAALGVLLAGGTYLPLDPAAPEERRRWILEDAQAKIVIDLDEVSLSRAERGGGPGKGLRPPAQEDLAYLIYTSGSTGRPKGVEIRHAGLSNLIAWTHREFGLTPADRTTWTASPAFDASVWELWTSLAAGATLCIPPQEILADPRDLPPWLTAERITRCFLPPILAAGLLDQDLPLRTLWTGGDRCPAPAREPGFEFVNLYGPTEATVMVTFQRVAAAGPPPIGRPIAGSEVHLLDRGLRPVPLGATGEICLGGIGLARGYRGRPDLTAERFVPHPFAGDRGDPGARLYRTGDLGRRRPDGALDFLGRADQQVKVRGFRVELGEIEVQLALHPAVREAAVVLREGAAGARLAAFFALRPGASAIDSELRGFLKERLPDYMLPASYTELPALPLTPSGKVDRAALLRAEPAVQPEAREAGDPVERRLAALWRELLDVPEVDPDANFFDLGGHSILLASLRARLGEVFGLDLPMMDLFENPTVASLASRLRQLESREDPSPSLPAPWRGEGASRPPRQRKSDGMEIAIIGLAGRFPGASDLETFWRNLRDGVESITCFTEDGTWTPPSDRESFVVPAGGVLEGPDLWDAGFFGFSRREAEHTDPQQRLFLECAWEAFENAGYDPARAPGRVGVFGGSSQDDYALLLRDRGALEDPEVRDFFITGTTKDFLATRVAYELGFEGPSFAVQGACSTSLVAIHLACQSLLSGDCDMALAGAASVSGRQRTGYLYQPGSALSPDGHCRSLDARAAGSVHSDGVGAVLLKRLADALTDGDTVRAVIRGSAVTNDGAKKLGFLAPRAAGRTDAIRAALHRAAAPPDSVTYIEAHGNGTPLGDLVELRSLAAAFSGVTPGRVALGSVKSNIGHTHGASGVIGLIKIVLALEHRQIPPSLHFESAHPEANLAGSPFYVNTALRAWETGGLPRRAGVSSFGHGGVNAHILLEEAPASPETPPEEPAWQLLPLSARTPAALEASTSRLADHLRRNPRLALADVAWALQMGRHVFEHRRFVLCRSLEEAVAALGGSPEGDPGTDLFRAGERWLAGAEIDWAAFHGGKARRRVPLPTYPFERQRYWIEEDPEEKETSPAAQDAGITDI